MAYKCLYVICITVLMLAECIDARKHSSRQETPTMHQATVRIPLLKPLGISRPKLVRNLDEQRFGQEYIEQYQEMMKASQESFENFDERDDKRLRRLIGDDDLELMAEAGGLGRRRVRSGGHLSDHSILGKRRSRSQALRREKLYAQSLTSHRRHSQLKPNYLHDI